MKEIEKVLESFHSEIEKVTSLDELNALRVKYLGKKGIVTSLMKNLKNLPNEEKPIFGQRVNKLKNTIEELLSRKREEVNLKERKLRYEKERLDVTLPGARKTIGHRHLISKVLQEIEDVFLTLGYEIVEGPEVETEYYNFDALNTPEWHPARDSHDTFYISTEDKTLLRSHTSPVQVRTMKKTKPPIKIIAPGKVYRKDYDVTHLPMFHQVEGLVVGKDISVVHLKGTLDYFAKNIFGPERKTRLVPSFFPFTEPSFEVYVSCGICGGKGCKSCGFTGWLEIMGAGMVDPNVFEEVGYDPEEWTGFAFGMGVERIAMLKYNVDDIRLFPRNDIRFLEQF
ncbi:MAG: phenylalanyl-tRNA synthetase alpha chain [Thermotogaceae bacterium]|jgi:phenylalanyl-tRNA synthetase alpha chain|nr:phenylalanyl-tRNA synthetase alpha chain [Thermotogaceae bacterium]MDN5338108.1 phenylalanyl-tRNA synthetase alpha chain [Thermotogaceae bacterium]